MGIFKVSSWHLQDILTFCPWPYPEYFPGIIKVFCRSAHWYIYSTVCALSGQIGFLLVEAELLCHVFLMDYSMACDKKSSCCAIPREPDKDQAWAVRYLGWGRQTTLSRADYRCSEFLNLVLLWRAAYVDDRVVYISYTKYISASDDIE